MPPSAEQILLEEIRNGSEQAFASLVDRHSDRLISLAWRLVGRRDEAEDIAQEAFLRLFRSLESFRGESSIGTWLYRTVTRLAIDHLRRERLKRRIFFFRSRDDAQADPLDLAVDPHASPHEELQGRETARRMQQVLQTLPARQRAVFILRHQEEMPLKEIARTLGLEEGTVKAHLHRAVNQFRKAFHEHKESI